MTAIELTPLGPYRPQLSALSIKQRPSKVLSCWEKFCAFLASYKYELRGDPILRAYRRGDLQAMEGLLRRRVAVSKEVHQAVYEDQNIPAILLVGRCDPSFPLQDVLDDLFCKAVGRKAYSFAAGLIDHGVSPNITRLGEETVLHVAAELGAVKFAESLLLRGASVNAKDSKGRTPLEYAVKAGHGPLMEALFKSYGAL